MNHFKLLFQENKKFLPGYSLNHHEYALSSVLFLFIVFSAERLLI